MTSIYIYVIYGVFSGKCQEKSGISEDPGNPDVINKNVMPEDRGLMAGYLPPDYILCTADYLPDDPGFQRHGAMGRIYQVKPVTAGFNAS